MDHGKELPPLTLSSTSVSCLVTLIPVLVSMTSHSDVPCYEDETDKPAWWPSDIQWRNPKFYVQDADKKDDCLKVLRKLVYSCYSYHGVEDLLCRLEETPVSDSEAESGDNMEIIQLTEEGEEPLDDSSAESDGPVFVCCFCLDQFNSHEHVNAHQSTCSKRFSESSNGPRNAACTDKSQRYPVTKHIDTKDCLVESFLGPTECPTSPPDIASDFLNVISSSSSSLLHISSSKTFDKCGTTSIPQISTSSNYLSRSSHISAPLPSSATMATLQKRLTTTITNTVPNVPTLKTRSQKKMDQIMEKHNMRRLMLQECREMKEVPRTGAWWSKKIRRKNCTAHQLQDTAMSQNNFMLSLGLAQSTYIAAMAKRGPKHEQEVDLDCEITSVEGPLSLVPAALSPKAVVEKPPSTSPRSTRSLMSQLSRDSEVNTRRKLSFCFVEDEWADKQAINEGRDPLQISLLTLEFSSPLGQRIKKYVRGEGHLNTIKDIESYCKTELDEDGYSKLRYRGCDFRITFRKKRRASHHVHTYKFNKFDRMEFKKLLKTGLSAYSRHLMKCLPMCKVLLNRLRESEIKLWTEAKKITISEQIIYDDDLCITQIDIPESRITQGFAPDIHSQSQHHLYRQTPPFGPSSPLSAGRLNITSDSRSIFSPRISASPPHVPNIFRSRTSHTSSPPRPGPVIRPHNVSSGWRPQQLPNKARKITEEQQECSRFDSSYNVKNNNLQHKALDRPSQNSTHISGHMCLTPSTYTYPDRSVADPKSNGEINNANNRRKQQLTHVRNDDGDGGGAHATTAKKSCISVGNASSNPPRRGLMENRHSDTMQKKPGPASAASVGQPLGPSMRRLSNFDYFSIRDGTMQPSYPQHSHAVVSQHRTYPNSAPAAHSHNHQNVGPFRQNSHYPGHNRHCPPSSSVASCPRHNYHNHHHHHQHSSMSQPPSGQVRPSAILDLSPSQQHSSLSNNGTPLGSPLSMNHHEANRPQTVKKMNFKAPSLRQNRFSEDDDVMEIICIDDD